MGKSRATVKECSKCKYGKATMQKLCRNKTCKHFNKENEPSIKKSGAKDDKPPRKSERQPRKNPKFNDSEKPIQNKNEKKNIAKRPKPVNTEIPLRRSQRNSMEAKAAKALFPHRKIPLFSGPDICGQLSKEKQELAALFLSEINRKLSSVVWKF